MKIKKKIGGGVGAGGLVDILKAQGGVDFTKCALIFNMCNGRKLTKVQNAVNLSKIILSTKEFFMHIYSMSAKY